MPKNHDRIFIEAKLIYINLVNTLVH